MKRFVVRKSQVHGKGVFALQEMKPGELLIEYKGTVVNWRRAVRNHALTGAHGHTFLFGLSNGDVIDGAAGGNSARWINHACDANCQAVEIDNRIFIEVARDIAAGEEIFLNYGLQVEAPVTDDIRREYACHCGSTVCRGTMLAAAAM